LALRKEGYPIDGICVAAGVPSLEVANEIVQSCKSCGLRHVAFKPATSDAIRRVVAIAQNNSDFPIILQWTGGRSGGHHSFEDFHQPLLETYSLIRSRKNIVLVVGSGFGDATGSLPYLIGSWSQKFGYPPMPVDGILLASRMLVSKESLASLPTKQLIVNTPGIQNETEWTGTYKRETGGILTVKSELGEPIHMIATRGVKLWKEFDDTIFSLSKEQRLQVLREKKEYIIQRLNADYQRVWFGKRLDGTVVDLEDMTYYEVCVRLLELMYVTCQQRWIDVSYQQFVFTFLKRVEERFISFCNNTQTTSLLRSFVQTSDPRAFVEQIFNNFPLAKTQLLTSDDIRYFLSLCERPDQKPVPFIPILDEKFEIYFKKDSLWGAEDVDAIPGQDVGRVCILQGPVAVKYSTKVNESVQEILGNIEKEYIEHILKTKYQSNEKMIPTVEYFGGSPIHFSDLLDSELRMKWETTKDGEIRVIEMPENMNDLPSTTVWFEYLAGNRYSWIRALITNPYIVQHRFYHHNVFTNLLKPRPKQKFILHFDKSQTLVCLELFDSRTNSLSESTPSLKLWKENDNIVVLQLFFVKTKNNVIPLTLKYRYCPQIRGLIFELVEVHCPVSVLCLYELFLIVIHEYIFC
jgi:fatty acid synthase subunit beta